MNRGLKVAACTLVTVSMLSVGVSSAAISPNGADVVSAATTATPTPAPAKPAPKPTPAKPAPAKPAPAKPAPAKPAPAQPANEEGLLGLGSFGDAVTLLQTKLNENGFNLRVDGFFGEKTLKAVKSFQEKNGLDVDGIVGPLTLAVLNPTVAETTPTPAPTPAPVPEPVQKISVQLGKAEYAAHGTKCFTVAFAAVSGDTIFAASIDDYQYMSTDVAKGVPNSDADFGKNVADPKMVLASKRANAVYYSEHMKEAAKATTPVDKSLDAIQAYVAGKTITELEKTLTATPKEKMVDVVSGATLVDTHGYVSAIVAAAKAAKKSATFEINASDIPSLKLGKVEYAAHGTKCFTIAVAAVVGDKIIAALTDDYQYMGTDVAKGVPNSDADFGKNYKDPKMVLASKRVNAAYYSEHMKEAAKATLPVNVSLDSINAFVAGKTITELEKTLTATPKEKMVDVVSGATLVDTHGYVSAIVAAAKAAK